MQPAPKMNWFQKYIIAPVAVVLMTILWGVFQVLMFIPFVLVTLLKFASGNGLMSWGDWKELVSESWADLF